MCCDVPFPEIETPTDRRIDEATQHGYPFAFYYGVKLLTQRRLMDLTQLLRIGVRQRVQLNRHKQWFKSLLLVDKTNSPQTRLLLRVSGAFELFKL